MSGGRGCKCSERQAPLEVAEGSNDRERQWWILQYLCNHSAFNGYHETPSGYSTIACRVCGSAWRTKASYVHALPFAPADWYARVNEAQPTRESLGLSPGEGVAA